VREKIGTHSNRFLHSYPQFSNYQTGCAWRGSQGLSWPPHRDVALLKDNLPELARVEASVGPALVTTRHRVLIVDDEPIVELTLTKIFEGAGYDARSASTAEKALELMASWRPTLAVLDVILPGIDGIQLSIEIKKIYPECVVLLLSGIADAPGLLPWQTRENGNSFDVLAKPIHPTELLALCGSLLSD